MSADTTIVRRAHALTGRQCGDTALVETPTHVVQRLMRRQRPEHSTARQSADATATVEVMLRVLPPPRLLLAVSRCGTAQALKAVLEDMEFEIVEATGDHEALSLATASRCPIVLTDSLPLLADLRSESGERYVHLVFVTDDPLDSSSAMRAGADDIVDFTAGSEQLRFRMQCARRLADFESGLRTALLQNQRLSTVDELTGVANRRFFARIFPRELARARRARHALTIIMCDIDLFKRINDTYGHPVGDAVLREFGLRLQSQLRRGIDWVARLGGEEFAIVMPDTDSAGGLAAAHRLRECIRRGPFHIQNHPIAVTASFGLCTVNGVDLGKPRFAEQLLAASDQAMYRSKTAGRDRVTTAHLQPPRDQRVPRPDSKPIVRRTGR